MIRPTDDASPEVPNEGHDDATNESKITIRLTDFEGPLDLLLYLIQRDEIDIYDIPIAHITKQYLEYIDLLDVFGLDNAGEFLVMAATLMRIKARLLLPVQRSDEEGDELDPRDELVRRLLEYKKYKEAAGKLGQAEDERREYFARGVEFPYQEQEEEPPEFTLSMFDLLQAVRNVLDNLQADQQHHVYTEVWTVEAQTDVILELVEQQERVQFEEIFAEARAKMQVVVTFVAMLELLKRQALTAYQLDPYGPIWLSRGEPDPEDRDDEADSADSEATAQPSASEGEASDDTSSKREAADAA